MVVEYQQSDDSIKVFGYMMTDGPLSAATGRMVKGWHSKCFHIARKRAARGDSGRVVGSLTAYEVDEMQEQVLRLSARMSRIRQVAEAMGKSVGDPQVTEAFEAQERGGPYAHHHTHRLDTYQLIAHLEYAHGIRDQNLLRTGAGVIEFHGQLHAKQALLSAVQDRIDGQEEERPDRDWRTQYTMDVE